MAGVTSPEQGETADRLDVYRRVIQRVFERNRTTAAETVTFDRSEVPAAAHDLGLPVPSNIGDVIYAFRFRTALPPSIQTTAPAGKQWVIRLRGHGRYAFELAGEVEILPDPLLAETKVPDATPGVITAYRLSDEQALLATVRYNRLIDTFTGITCYSLQNHLRTSVKGMGQVEVDELYVGIDRRGVHYVLPVQAKGGKDRLSIVQIEQDMAFCAERFPQLTCRPVAAQFTPDGLIALFGFQDSASGAVKWGERHYRLVPPDGISPEELALYRGNEP